MVPMAFVDLSHTIYAGMPRIHVLPEVEFAAVRRIEQGHPLNISELKLATHVGTHVDAPWHFVPNGRTIDQIPLDDLSGPAVVVPVQRGAGEPITAEDLERSPEPVREGDIVVLYTGWSDKFDSEEYDHHPYIGEDAAQWLVNRKAKMLAVDLITVDLPQAMRPTPFAYPVHHKLLENDVLIAENLTNLRSLVGKRVKLFAFPISIKGSDASQARIVAEV